MPRTICSIGDCGEAARGHGFCASHLYRFRRYGDPQGSGRRYTRGTDEERFWAFVEKNARSGCWLWTGGTVDGYGAFNPASSKSTVRAHRYAYALVRSAVPGTLVLDHTCRVRRCVNPDHLEAVTVKENTLRGVGFSAMNLQKSACPKGHPYDDENTYVDKKTGWRQCRTCRRERVAEQNRRHAVERGTDAVSEPGPGKGAAQLARTECPQGHPYSGSNLLVEKYVRRNGTSGERRRCRACVAQRRRRV